MNEAHPTITTPPLSYSDLNDIMDAARQVMDAETRRDLNPTIAAQVVNAYVGVVTRPRMVALIMGNLKNNEAVQRDVADGRWGDLVLAPTVLHVRSVYQLAKLACEVHPAHTP